jgi:hypothetical protein
VRINAPATCELLVTEANNWKGTPFPNLLFVRTESFACVVDFLTARFNLWAKRIRCEVALVYNSRINVKTHGDNARMLVNYNNKAKSFPVNFMARQTATFCHSRIFGHSPTFV